MGGLTKLPDNHPKLLEWKKYQQTHEYKAVEYWISDNTLGSGPSKGAQWELFSAGWNAALKSKEPNQ